jgi:hypothetical protein
VVQDRLIASQPISPQLGLDQAFPASRSQRGQPLRMRQIQASNVTPTQTENSQSRRKTACCLFIGFPDQASNL